MIQNEFTLNIAGIVPPVITPLSGRDQLDVDGCRRVVDYLLDGGVHGLFFLGTTGEGTQLPDTTRKALLEEVCPRVANRVPIMVAVTDNAFDASVRQAGAAADAGADVAVLAAPHYLKPRAKELEYLARRFAQAQPLPVMLYNIPQVTGTRFSASIINRLLDVPKIIGVKDSSPDYEQVRVMLELKRKRPGFCVMIGNDESFVRGIGEGMDGVVSGLANLAPELAVELYNAIQNQDDASVKALHRRFTLLRLGLDLPGGVEGVVRSLKHGLSLLGLCSSEMATPFMPAEGTAAERMKAAMIQAGLLSKDTKIRKDALIKASL
jgi:dihydrodipicolinate synthase/N-acetylneuraminate lyase